MKATALPANDTLDSEVMMLDTQVGASFDEIINVPRVVLSWPQYLMSRHKKLMKAMGFKKKRIRAKL
ncbi:hypothetical protein CJU89_3461 [Yarrowia sp. B02]|nr:hypothetical protein CJU89_3461 [Yarrowia sp. B02]